MSAKFTPEVRTFCASSFIDAMRNQFYIPWKALTNYSEGSVVSVGNNKYVAKNTGLSGQNTPTHISGAMSDGGIEWIFVEYINKNYFFERNTYIGIGKNTPWDNESVPDEVKISELYYPETIKNLMTLKSVTFENLRLACTNNKWSSGFVYSQYDDKKELLSYGTPESYTTPFFVITDNKNVYKCINNNNNAQSVSKPTNTSPIMFMTADGYMWKFIGSLKGSSARFENEHFFPLDYREDDGSEQFITQEFAIPLSLSTFNILKSSGEFDGNIIVDVIGGNPIIPALSFATKNEDDTIRQILVDPNNIGRGYDTTKRVIALAKKHNEPGSGGTVQDINVVNGVIQSITIDNAGINYSNGAILLIHDRENIPTEEAVVNVVISGGNDSIQQFQIISGGSGYSNNVEAYVIPGNAGALGEAVFAPKNGHGFNIITELAANSVIVNLLISDSDSSSYFLTGESNAFRQVVFLTDIKEKDTLLPAQQTLFIGPSHPSYGTGSLKEIDDNSGNIIYINNLTKVIRSAGQNENITITLTF